MFIMASITHHQQMKGCSFNPNFPFPMPQHSNKRLHADSSQYDWSIDDYRNKKLKQIDDQEEKYHCLVYLKLFPSTLKCSIDVIVNSSNELLDDDDDAILIGKTRISKTIQAGVIRVRLVSSLFTADMDVHEDLSLIKLETILRSSSRNHFDKQFALVFKNSRIGPGVIGKLFIESLDPSTGSYTNNSPIFELNLHLPNEHEILLTSSYQKISFVEPLKCGCILSSSSSQLLISDQCNFNFNDMKLIHRLSEPLRCLWKSLGRELAPCFTEIDLNDLHQRYFLTEGNHECTYQLLREWYIREPQQANIRYLLTRLKLPFHVIQIIHNDILRTFSSSS